MLSVRSCSPRGDEALDALDVPGAVGLRDRPGAAGADVGAGVGLGEHHGRAPLLVDEELGPLLLLARCPRRCSTCAKDGPEAYIQIGALAPSTSSASDHHRARGASVPPSSAGQVEAPELGVHERLVRLLERLRQRRGVGRRVEDRRVAVAVGVAGGEVLAGQPVDLGEDVARGVDVEVGVRLLAERLVGPEDLEEVELEVAQVALVVASSVPGSPLSADVELPVSNTNCITRR